MNYFCSQKPLSCEGEGIYLIGIGFDGTVCFRDGARHGPAAIRRVSDSLEDYSPYLHKSLQDISGFYDLGDIEIPDGKGSRDGGAVVMAGMEQHYHEKLTGLSLDRSRVLTLGGEHSVSLVPLKYYLEHYPDLVILHLDAHADLRDGYKGFHYSHASVIYRMLEHFKQGHELIQYGIRSGTVEEYCLMKERGTLISCREEFLQKISSLCPSRPIYLTFDLDYFDPSIFPGTGTPEPGGEDFHSFLKLIKILNKKNFVGADVVELSPGLDPSDMSSIVAAKVVREIVLALDCD